MPTYDFRCPNGHEFERFLKMSEVPPTLACPECGAEAERLISAGAGLMFKGSGFYLTDYGKNAHRQPTGETKSTEKSGAESKSESTSESKSEAKSESKSETKSESKAAGTASTDAKPARPAKPSTE